MANGGKAVTPRLVRGTTANGKAMSSETAQYDAVPVFSAESAETVRRLMIDVVENGSGYTAKPESGGAGGKTASAQTGQLDESGEEIVHAWFAGFYPAENPRFAIVVFVEGGDSGSDAAAPVFREIANGLCALGM
jgi:penicillin-binding protein 2